MEFQISTIQASIRGNKEDNIPNQDYIDLYENEDILIATASDGLGSSKRSLEGAKIACEVVIEKVQNFHLYSDLQLLDESINSRWEKVVSELSGSLTDFRTASSFVAIFKNEKKVIVGQLGDVLISLRADGLFRYLQKTSKDFSNETNCLGSGGKDHFKMALYEFGHSFDFLIATDGVADELQPERIEHFHDFLKRKFENIEMEFRNNILQNEIEKFFTDKNNDDKSLIFTWSNKN